MSAKLRVLFVDDEDNVLQGLRRQMREQRAAWEMQFFNSASVALSYMAANPVDVVVSDMRMPNIDGAQFLNLVRSRHPKVVRIILSGFAEREAILRTIGPSHRYLAKPCAQRDLVGAIDQALALRRYIDLDDVRGTVSQLTHLPTLPTVYVAIMKELEAEFASVDSLAEKISEDVAVSAQLIKLTNSAYFSLPVQATTVRQAIHFLGFENVRSVLLLTGVFEQFRGISPLLAHAVERLTHHSLQLGILTQGLAKSEKLSDTLTDQAFCAGVLAHVGTLLLMANDATIFNEAMQAVDRREASLCDAECARFGANHAQLGAYLLGLWGFNDSIVEAVGFHHHPSAAGQAPSSILTVLHVAQYLMRATSRSKTHYEAAAPLDTEYLHTVGMVERMPIWQSAFERISQEWPRD